MNRISAPIKECMALPSAFIHPRAQEVCDLEEDPHLTRRAPWLERPASRIKCLLFISHPVHDVFLWQSKWPRHLRRVVLPPWHGGAGGTIPTKPEELGSH